MLSHPVPSPSRPVSPFPSLPTSFRRIAGKLLVDFFYARFSFSHQQSTLLDRNEPALRSMQSMAEDARDRHESARAVLRQAGTHVRQLCEHLTAPPSEIAIPRNLLPSFSPLLAPTSTSTVAPSARDGAPPLASGGGSSASSSTEGESGKRGVLFVQQGLLRQWKRCWCVLAGGHLTIYRLAQPKVSGGRGGGEGGVATGADDARASADARTSEKGVGGLKRLVDVPLTLCNVKPVRETSASTRLMSTRPMLT
jgi:hypothetical protein